MPLPTAVHDIPAHLYPVTLEAFNPATGAVVWRATMQKPRPGTRSTLRIPALKKELGFAVGMRVRYGDGSVKEQLPDAAAS